jgi:hypothetical protein
MDKPVVRAAIALPKGVVWSARLEPGITARGSQHLWSPRDHLDNVERNETDKILGQLGPGLKPLLVRSARLRAEAGIRHAPSPGSTHVWQAIGPSQLRLLRAAAARAESNGGHCYNEPNARKAAHAAISSTEAGFQPGGATRALRPPANLYDPCERSTYFERAKAD